MAGLDYNRTMQFTVLVEKGPTSFGAWLPDLPGCVAVGKTREEALELIAEAIALHMAALREDGDEIPVPVTSAAVLEVAA